MNWAGETDCPNCGLAGVEMGDDSFPFCDRLCAVRFAERRALRQLRIDMFRWNRIEPIRHKIRTGLAATMKRFR